METNNNKKIFSLTRNNRLFISAVSHPNVVLSKKLCHYLNQGRTSSDILMKAAHWMAYFYFSKLYFAQANILKAFESQLQW